jgi:hypothetical protein
MYMAESNLLRLISQFLFHVGQYFILVDLSGRLLVRLKTRLDWEPMLNNGTIQTRDLRIIPSEAIFIFF